eukprot:5126558-Amphidinium_carterae.1
MANAYCYSEALPLASASSQAYAHSTHQKPILDAPASSGEMQLDVSISVSLRTQSRSILCERANSVMHSGVGGVLLNEASEDSTTTFSFSSNVSKPSRCYGQMESHTGTCFEAL